MAEYCCGLLDTVLLNFLKETIGAASRESEFLCLEYESRLLTSTPLSLILLGEMICP